MNRFTFMLVCLLLAAPVAAQEHHHHHAHHEEHGNVQLNDGQRWKANAETTEGIRAMQEHIAGYRTREGADKTELHRQLQEDFQAIFAKCTMEGEAHEQLHVYLLPLRERLRELEECSGQDCEKVLSGMEGHLGKYDTWFE